MIIKTLPILGIAAALLGAGHNAARAQQQADDEASTPPAQQECALTDRLCIMGQIAQNAPKIENKNWRDQTLRELAKSYAADGKIDEAIAIIPQVETPDTRAMTIRGIGMALADLNKPKAEADEVFARLRAEADKITHEPSFAIALTYIAMSQAFAGDNEGAWATAASMKNDALRHKAYAETAEIQAEAGDFDSAMKSIGFIESIAFRNKAYEITSGIFTKKEMFAESYKAALKIENAYKRAKALQVMLDAQAAAARAQTEGETKP